MFSWIDFIIVLKINIVEKAARANQMHFGSRVLGFYGMRLFVSIVDSRM